MRINPGPYELHQTFLHLHGDGVSDPVTVTESFWAELAGGGMPHLEDGRLVSRLAFAEPWSSWEMHPNGDEVVLLLSGAVDIVLEDDGDERVIALRQAGSFVIVPRGTWHTARPLAPSTMLFITPGRGTQGRPVTPA